MSPSWPRAPRHLRYGLEMDARLCAKESLLRRLVVGDDVPATAARHTLPGAPADEHVDVQVCCYHRRRFRSTSPATFARVAVKKATIFVRAFLLRAFSVCRVFFAAVLR